MRCPSCRAVVGNESAFCPRCGTALSTEVAAPAAAATAPSQQQQWTPPQQQWTPPQQQWAAPVAGYGAPASDPTAVMGRRIASFFIDGLITVVVLFALVATVKPLGTQGTVEEMINQPGCRPAQTSAGVKCNNRIVFTLNDKVIATKGGSAFGFFGIEGLMTLLYFGVLGGATGATVGKLATGIRVVRADGSIIGVPRSLVRWLLFAVDGPLTGYLCGLITSLATKGHRRVGDMAAGSYVVAKAAVGQPVLVGSAATPAATFGAAAPAPAPTPSSAEPQWDQARGVYVLWDAASGHYLSWNEQTQSWE
jgi:uncharacterized RDD family membrane protein YckC